MKNLCFSFFDSIFFFSCTSKYVGEFCQHLNPCHTGPGPRCQNGGSCEVQVTFDGSPSFKCNCPFGFSASLCEIPIPNSCDQRPCLNGGVCSLLSLEEYQCSCSPGYTGELTLWSIKNIEWRCSVSMVESSISSIFWHKIFNHRLLSRTIDISICRTKNWFLWSDGGEFGNNDRPHNSNRRVDE